MAQMGAGGTLVTLELRHGKPAAFAMLNALRLIRVSNNLGDSKSLATHPATTTHMRIGAEERARLGITDGVVRLSVGLEDARDLIADLGQALEMAAAARAAPGHPASGHPASGHPAAGRSASEHRAWGRLDRRPLRAV
jgi:O-succinylhomoserine sulfhydrylase